MHDSITVKMQDGRTFIIEPILGKTEGEAKPAARLWFNGLVVHAAFGDSVEDAMDKMFSYLRDNKKNIH